MLTAVIGGTGLDRFDTLHIERRETMATPYGPPSAPLSYGTLNGRKLVFLARHGDAHALPPHRINYRANLWALNHAGVSDVIGIAAVGGITPAMRPARLVFPDQVIDYTYGRAHTFFDGDDASGVEHVDFTYPYSEALRQRLITAARGLELNACEHGIYGATQGPRLESAAEIRRLERDGCDLVGMTGMPEAGLARELGLSYACCAVVVNWAAGKTAGEITMEEIRAHLTDSMGQVKALLAAVI